MTKTSQLSKKRESTKPRYDKAEFEILFDPDKDTSKPAYQLLTDQGRHLLQRLYDATIERGRRALLGHELKEVVEVKRDEYFPETRQKEVFRVFQDHRARFVRAGFLRVNRVEEARGGRKA